MKIAKVYSFDYIIEETHKLYLNRTKSISKEDHIYRKYQNQELIAEYIIRNDKDFQDIINLITNNSIGYDEGGVNMNLRIVPQKTGYLRSENLKDQVFLRLDRETLKYFNTEEE